MCSTLNASRPTRARSRKRSRSGASPSSAASPSASAAGFSGVTSRPARPSSSAATDPPILSAIYVLGGNPAVTGVTIEALALPDAMRVLENQAYRPRLRRELNAPRAIVAQAAAVLRHARVFTFERPLGFDRLDETLDALERHWRAV